jgi:hypothetical protein
VTRSLLGDGPAGSGGPETSVFQLLHNRKMV